MAVSQTDWKIVCKVFTKQRAFRLMPSYGFVCCFHDQEPRGLPRVRLLTQFLTKALVCVLDETVQFLEWEVSMGSCQRKQTVVLCKKKRRPNFTDSQGFKYA